MPTDDQTQESVSTEEGTVEEKPEDSQESTGSLEDENDVGKLRERVKFLESENVKKDKILERNRKKQEKPATPEPQNFVKPEDLAIVVTNQARELVSDEVREHWDDLLKIPLSGYDSKDARSIAQNMSERLAIYKARTTDKSNSGKDLRTSSGVRGSVGKTPETKAHTIPKFLSADDQAKQLYGE